MHQDDDRYDYAPVIGAPGDDGGRGRIVSLLPAPADLSWVNPSRGAGYGRVAPVG